MYYDEHNPPHFHAKYDGEEALIMMDGNIFSGTLPQPQYRLVKAWLEIHRNEILEDWEDAREGRDLTSIRGLR